MEAGETAYTNANYGQAQSFFEAAAVKFDAASMNAYFAWLDVNAAAAHLDDAESILSQCDMGGMCP